MKNVAIYKRINKQQFPFEDLDIAEENVDKNGGVVGDIT